MGLPLAVVVFFTTTVLFPKPVNAVEYKAIPFTLKWFMLVCSYDDADDDDVWWNNRGTPTPQRRDPTRSSSKEAIARENKRVIVRPARI